MKYSLLFIFTLMMNIQYFAQDQKLIFKSDEITIPINTELKFSANLQDGKLLDFKLKNQSEIKKPIDMMASLENIVKKNIVSNEIEMQFSEADIMGSKLIVLTTVQHFEKPILFKAKIKLKGNNDYFETSIVPKIPNVFSVEQWNDDIESIYLFDFTIDKQ